MNRAEPIASKRLFAFVTNQTRADRLRDRATRLRREASNCLSIAIRERDTGTVADLIDEAIRLVRRSGELAAA